MKTLIAIGFAVLSLVLSGCGKKPSTPSATETASGAPATEPVFKTALAAWEQGDQATAIKSFLAADWSARPLFPTGSTLNLSEAQFKALAAAEREAQSKEMLSQLATVKSIGSAVAQAGRDAAAKGDTTQARKYFASLKQCGTELNNPERLLLVQLVGQALKKMAEGELSKLGQ